MAKQDIWHQLNAISMTTDIYGIAKANKLLPKGFTKDLYKIRGGILLEHLEVLLTKDSSLKTLFGL